LIPTKGTTLKRHMPLAGGRGSKRAFGIALIASVLMSGCAYAPSINVLGAYFPDWLFCIVAGVAFTVVIHAILTRLHVVHLLIPSALVYTKVAIFLACAVWLIAFQH
jgi:hypothetical protein